jgi:putative oxidoreductase
MTTTTSFRGWTLAARVLMAAIFLIAGVRKLMTYGATLGYFAKLGIPLADVVLPLTIALEIGGFLLLIVQAGAGERTAGNRS